MDVIFVDLEEASVVIILTSDFWMPSAIEIHKSMMCFQHKSIEDTSDFQNSFQKDRTPSNTLLATCGWVMFQGYVLFDLRISSRPTAVSTYKV